MDTIFRVLFAIIIDMDIIRWICTFGLQYIGQ